MTSLLRFNFTASTVVGNVSSQMVDCRYSTVNFTSCIENMPYNRFLIRKSTEKPRRLTLVFVI